jgi:WD40 repeat protein
MREPILIHAHSDHIPALHFTPDSLSLVSGGMDNLIKLWSVPGWELQATLEGHEKSVNALSLSPSGETLASGSSDATVKLWRLPTGELQHTLQDRKRVVAAIRFSPDARWVAAASYGGRAMVWTISGDPVVGLTISKKNVVSLAFSPDSRHLAVAGLGDDISIRAMPSGDEIARLSGHQTAVWALRYVGRGRQLVSLGYEQSVRFWDTGKWECTRVLPVAGGGARGLALSADEESAAMSLEGRIELRSVKDWSVTAELPVSVKAIYGTTFSPDGRWLAAGAADGNIRVWQVGD